MTDNKCLASVCIPTLNAQKFIRHTLNNILKNDFDAGKYEILICDNDSADDTVMIVNEYMQKYNNIRLLHIPFVEPNRPLVRNTLIKNARGNILMFIDQDILVSSGFIREHVSLHAKYSNLIVAGYTFGKYGMNEMNPADNSLLKKIDLDNITESREILKFNKCFKDSRETLQYVIPGGDSYIDLTNTTAPFKSFWLCNISVRKDEIVKLGSFDELFKAWGLDDEDLAYRYEYCGGNLIFSNDAWAYHMYHPVYLKKHVATWRENCNFLFRKYETRELEFFTVYKGHLNSAAEELKLDLETMPGGKEYKNLIELAAKNMPSPLGRRLGVFVFDEQSSGLLKLTDCFNPKLGINTKPYENDNCRFWPLAGINTVFDDKEIDETVVIADIVMFLDDTVLKLLLLELSRISKTVYVFYSEHLQTQNNGLFGRFDKILHEINFASLKTTSFPQKTGK